MITWTAFGKLAFSAMRMEADDDLRNILTSVTQPTKIVNEVGCPLPNSALVNQHPDPANYLRTIRIRRDIAIEKKAHDYAQYADAIIKFFETSGPFSEVNPLWLILIVTHKNQYEFLYAPKTDAVIGMPVGHLNA